MNNEHSMQSLLAHACESLQYMIDPFLSPFFILLVLIQLHLISKTLSQNYKKLQHTDTKTQLEINGLIYLQVLLFFHQHSYLIHFQLFEWNLISATTIFKKLFMFLNQFVVLKITKTKLKKCITVTILLIKHLVLLPQCSDTSYCYQN